MNTNQLLVSQLPLIIIVVGWFVSYQIDKKRTLKENRLRAYEILAEKLYHLYHVASSGMLTSEKYAEIDCSLVVVDVWASAEVIESRYKLMNEIIELQNAHKKDQGAFNVVADCALAEFNNLIRLIRKDLGFSKLLEDTTKYASVSFESDED